MTIGRPTKYTPELAEKICLAISISTDSLTKICEQNEGFPSKKVIHEWKIRHPTFRAMYAEAKSNQAELLAEEITEISDDWSLDIADGEHGPIYLTGKVQRDRLRVDSRKWIACKLLPKVYGDKSEVKSDITAHVTTHEDRLKELE